MSLKQDRRKESTREFSPHNLTSLVMRVDVPYQAILTLDTATLLERMLQFSLERVPQDT